MSFSSYCVSFPSYCVHVSSDCQGPQGEESPADRPRRSNSQWQAAREQLIDIIIMIPLHSSVLVTHLESNLAYLCGTSTGALVHMQGCTCRARHGEGCTCRPWVIYVVPVLVHMQGKARAGLHMQALGLSMQYQYRCTCRERHGQVAHGGPVTLARVIYAVPVLVHMQG